MIQICDHNWIDQGGRRCPKDIEPEWTCSQTVYQCSECEEYDYGEEGGPGYKQCKDCDLSLEKRKYTFINTAALNVISLGDDCKYYVNQWE